MDWLFQTLGNGFSYETFYDKNHNLWKNFLIMTYFIHLVLFLKDFYIPIKVKVEMSG